MPTASETPLPQRAIDEGWMRHAIALAERARGQTHPNPLVGAVLVKDGKLLAEGWHAHDGGPHAEIVALGNLACPEAAKGATIYVTLEPCSTHGRTGACTDAIIRAGIARVVIGATDPAPGHGGNAIPVLQKAGIEVCHGVLAEQCADLNLIFNHRIVSGQPFIAAKVAVTLDGKIATRQGNSRWITGEAARADVMYWRRYFPAIGVGAGTILADNPSLTVRPQQTAQADRAKKPATAECHADTDSSTPGAESPPAAFGASASGSSLAGATHSDSATAGCAAALWCPRRLVFDRHGKTAQRPDATVFTDVFAHRTLIITAEGTAEKQLEPLRKAGIAIIALPQSAFEPQHFASALRRLLFAEQLTGLYAEGGGGLLSHLLAAGALDYLFSYRAPKLLADAEALSPFYGQSTDRMANAFKLCNVRHQSFGDDQLMRGHIVYPPQ